MKAILNSDNFNKGIFFIVILYINIGFKSIFRLFDELGVIPLGVFALTILSLMYFLTVGKKGRDLLLYSVIFYLFLAVFSFISPDYTAYGLQKAYLGLLLPMTIYVVLEKKSWTERELKNYFITAIFIVSAIAIPLKIRSGFFDRSTTFGLSGPITFAWLNGMAFLMVILKNKKRSKDFFLAIFFLLMILWSGSKGPLLGTLLLCTFFVRRIVGDKIQTKILLLLLVSIGAILIYYFQDDLRAIKSLIEFVQDPGAYSKGQGKGSLGSREAFFGMSINNIQNNPIIGVGFGGWQNHHNIQHFYPHNVVLEFLSETGFIGLLLFIILLVKVFKKGLFGYIGIYGVITLMFSGDFSYFRYALFPFLLSHLIDNKNELIDSKPIMKND